MKVVICAFNEALLLPVALSHVPTDIGVVVIDGAYELYPHDDPRSTDGTLDIARRRCEVIPAHRAWKSQVEKRTRSLHVGADVVFVLDADEALMSPVHELPEGIDVGWVTVISPLYEAPYLEPRVFRVRPGWHYEGRHHWIYDGDGRLVASHRTPGEDYAHAALPVIIENRRDTRTPERDEAKSRYRKRRNRDESRHRSEVPAPARGVA